MEMNYVICNIANSLPQCKGCPGSKPSPHKTICPYKVNWGITKFIGKLIKHDGKYWVKLNSETRLLVTMDPEKLCKQENRSKNMVCWLHEEGVEVMRLATHISSVHA